MAMGPPCTQNRKMCGRGRCLRRVAVEAAAAVGIAAAVQTAAGVQTAAVVGTAVGTAAVAAARRRGKRSAFQLCK